MKDIIGIIGAMDEEVEELKHIMDGDEIITKAGLDFHIGSIDNKKIIVVRSGIGKVNAAVCTQILIDSFGVQCVINIGVAGAVSHELDLGDIVISTDAVYHDFDVTSFGYDKGIIPRMEESYFKADENLVRLAKKAGDNLNVDNNIFVERIVSGDQFVADLAVKNQIKDEFNGFCTEMEGTAIAHVCHLNKVPFVIIRSISDKADNSAEMNYNDFVLIAAKNASMMIQSMVKEI